MAYTTLDKAKKQLNIEEDFTDDDDYITSLIDVVEASIANYCDGGLDDIDDEDMPTPVMHSALLLIAHLYLNRAVVSFAQGIEIPYSFKFLLSPYRATQIS